MSGAVVRSGRSILKRSCLRDYLKKAPTLPTNQSRSYCSRFPFLFRKLKDSVISPPSLYSSSSSTASSSSWALFSSSWIQNGLIGWYLGILKSRPILTKSLTSAGIYSASDVSSQRLAPTSSDSYDFLRTLRMAGYGMLIAGPTMHFWFNFVSKVLPKRDVVSTLKKIIAGQTVYGPIMTAVFFSSNAGLQGENCAEIIARLDRDLLPTLKNGLMYWPICDFIMFKFVPVQLQPLVSNSFAYLWTIYITHMASLKKVGSNNIALD